MCDVCLRECDESGIDGGGGYQDTGVNSTTENCTGKAQEQNSSWLHVAMMSLLWYLVFANLEARKLGLVAVLFFARSHHGTSDMSSFLLALLVRYLAFASPPTNEEFSYPEECEEVASFSLALGKGWTFTGVASGPRNQN